jgi:hypothetical protein
MNSRNSNLKLLPLRKGASRVHSICSLFKRSNLLLLDDIYFWMILMCILFCSDCRGWKCRTWFQISCFSRCWITGMFKFLYLIYCLVWVHNFYFSLSVCQSSWSAYVTTHFLIVCYNILLWSLVIQIIYFSCLHLLTHLQKSLYLLKLLFAIYNNSNHIIGISNDILLWEMFH